MVKFKYKTFTAKFKEKPVREVESVCDELGFTKIKLSFTARALGYENTLGLIKEILLNPDKVFSCEISLRPKQTKKLRKTLKYGTGKDKI